jgi:tRNA(fMet)-specific endonuclease VapC
MSTTEAVLLDTDVFSYLMKSHDTRAAIYRPHVKDKLTAISFVTVGELLYGAKRKGWGSKKTAELEGKLRGVVIVPYDRQLCDTYADLKTQLSTFGRVADDNDLWIAASAVRHSIPLITNNRKHFEHIPGLVIISEAPVIHEIKSQMEFGEAATGE